ncbi:MAG TPA: anaerobic ribonucleoside-triphosphate reductase activating protein [Candidatus Fimimorpha excrementavium]|nr:anaerobic ribonucleoside-triphosphate reductase activating protein [Candidatus Fimimorpha excrementavium]
MDIQGLQKLTLLDYPGKTACTIFLGGCNFRCPYCHNADLVLCPDRGEQISQETLFAFLKRRQGLLDGVCVTGGEPLLRRDLEPFLSSIRSLGFSVKLDTNGSFPDRLKELVRLGLVDYVAMDIKNSPEGYARTIGGLSDMLCRVEESVRFLLSDTVDYEFRTTMVKEFHREADFLSIGEWIRGAKRYFLQGFADSGNLVGGSGSFHGFSRQEAAHIRSLLLPCISQTHLRGYDT